jgi:predicted anti-sigma-YlaC factor YlaD
MAPPGDHSLAVRSASRAAKAAKRQRLEQERQEFRKYTSPNGLEVLISLSYIKHLFLSCRESVELNMLSMATNLVMLMLFGGNAGISGQKQQGE